MYSSGFYTQIGLSILLFIRAVLFLTKPELVISPEKLVLIPSEKQKQYRLEHSLVLLLTTLLLIIMAFVEPYFMGTIKDTYILIYIFVLLLLAIRLYRIDVKFQKN